MRCPKCGYISFDNVDKCLKCKKNIAETSQQIIGSVFHVTAPVFLNLTPAEEEVESDEIAFGQLSDVEPDNALDDIVDQDLDVLLDDDEDDAADIRLDLEDDGPAGETAEDDLPDLDGLSSELGEIEAFTEDDDEAPADDEIKIDLSDFGDELAEEPAGGMPAMNLPDELSDLSDLSPPSKADAAPAMDSPRFDMESEDDLDLGSLGDLLGTDEPAAPAAVATAAAAATAMAAASQSEPAPAAQEEETVLSLDMDEDLDFELDLGGLSIHDDK